MLEIILWMFWSISVHFLRVAGFDGIWMGWLWISDVPGSSAHGQGDLFGFSIFGGFSLVFRCVFDVHPMVHECVAAYFLCISRSLGMAVCAERLLQVACYRYSLIFKRFNTQIMRKSIHWCGQKASMWKGAIWCQHYECATLEDRRTLRCKLTKSSSS